MTVESENNIITVGERKLDIVRIASPALRQTIVAMGSYEGGISNWQDKTWKQKRKPCPLLCPG